MSATTRALLLLGVLALLSLGLATLADNADIRSFASNLAAGFVGSIATVFILDRALEKHESRRRAAAALRAFSMIRPAVLRHLGLMAAWYKAAAMSPPTPATLEDLFGEAFVETVRKLNLKADFQPGLRHDQMAGEGAVSLKSELTKCLELYGSSLDEQTFAVIDEMKESLFLAFMLTTLPHAPILPAGMFVQAADILRAHASRFIRLVTAMNAVQLQPITFNEEELASTTSHPMPGSARLTDEQFGQAPAKMGIGDGLPIKPPKRG